MKVADIPMSDLPIFMSVVHYCFVCISLVRISSFCCRWL